MYVFNSPVSNKTDISKKHIALLHTQTPARTVVVDVVVVVIVVVFRLLRTYVLGESV